jgi:hypothetical protein
VEAIEEAEMRSLIEDNRSHQTENVAIGPDAISLDLFQAIYRDPAQPLPIRMRAASMAIPYECAKLLATAIIQERDFATLLDQRLKRIADMKLIEAPPANGGGKPPPPLIDPPKQPLAHTPDRRFRRL